MSYLAAAGLLAGSGLAVLWWRPCGRLEGRTPRLAIGVMLAGMAAVWAGTFALVVASVAPEATRFVAACQTVWARLFSGQVSVAGVGLMVAWLLVLPGRAMWGVTVTGLRSRRLLRSARCVGEPLAFPSPTHSVLVVAGLTTPAVALGLLRPTIAVDAQFWHEADRTQREVVLAHEAAHVRGHHAVVDALARLLTGGLIPLPGARDAHACVRRHLEAIADDAAVHRHGRTIVGQVLGRLALQQAPRAGLGSAGCSAWRVQRLLAPLPRPAWRVFATQTAVLVPLLAGMLAVGPTMVLALAPTAQSHFCAV